MILKSASLTDLVKAVVEKRGTEPPFSGEYDHFSDSGTYLCRRCGLALFRSNTKFHSGCGWPSFDEEIENAVLRLPDPDGSRTEIQCHRCHAHLGHVFTNEGFTGKNIRHCVNSLALDFVSDLTVLDTEEAIYAAGCFWGVEAAFKKLPGVLNVEVGYTGGQLFSPSYQAVCSGTTGHYEAVRVVYDPQKITYEQLTKYFFEIHDATQTNGQGPDRGQQYQSVIFYYNEVQKQIALQVIAGFKAKQIAIATQVLPVSVFWRAEDYHQHYYEKQK